MCDSYGHEKYVRNLCVNKVIIKAREGKNMRENPEEYLLFSPQDAC